MIPCKFSNHFPYIQGEIIASGTYLEVAEQIKELQRVMNNEGLHTNTSLSKGGVQCHLEEGDSNKNWVIHTNGIITVCF